MRYKLTLLFALFVLVATAQYSSTSKGDQFFRDQAYARAAEYYMDVVKKGDVDNHVIHNLAECYRQLRDTRNAEVWYAQAVQLRDRNPIEIYHYAQALKSNEKYTEANNWMRLYNELVPEDRRAIMHLTAGNYDKKLNPVVQDHKISNLSTNTEGSDFGAQYYMDNSIVFSSNYKNNGNGAVMTTNALSGGNFLDLYIADELAGGAVNTPQLFSASINSKFNEGPVSFSNDFLQIYFTRNGKSAGMKNVYRLKIYRATLAGNDFVNIEPLPFSSEEYDICHPSMNVEGTKLYFASNMPGGYGGYDLYEVEFDKGFWGRPKNLGPEINTEGNEVFPFIHVSNTLFFASDGHVGLGGLDVFKARLVRGKFKGVENLKAPVSGPKDDFAYIIDSSMTRGYFSSNRPGGIGSDDIYSFVYEMQDEEYSLQGQVIDENEFTVSDLSVYIQDLNGAVLARATTDADGFYNFKLNRNNGYKIVTKGGAYEQTEEEVPVFPAGDTKTLTLRVRKNNYTLKGLVSEKATKLPMDNAQIFLTKNSSQLEQETITDNKGIFSFIIDPNSSYTIKILKPGFLTLTRVISTVGAAPGRPLEIRNLALEPIKVNQVIDVPNVYYESGKFNITSESAISLDKVVEFMQDNPTITVELASHTDSRGSNSNNLILSQKRAESAVDYIVSKGISRDRIVAKGYGETSLVNGCKDGVSCTAAQHAKNRRTEIKVISIG